MKIKFLWGGIILVMLAQACLAPEKKKASVRDLKLTFTHVFADQAFLFNHKYQNGFGDSVSFTKLQYYISNIELWGEEGRLWKENSSYHLISLERQDQGIALISLKDIPKQDFKEIRFAIGVDSIKNHSGVQRGDLDPIKGMFWTWNQGYIFFKCEGYHYKNPQKPRGLIFHIGQDDSYQELSFLIDPEKFKSSEIALNLQVNTEMLFGAFPQSGIRLKVPDDGKSINVMGGPKSSQIAQNYARMFSLPGAKKSGK